MVFSGKCGNRKSLLYCSFGLLEEVLLCCSIPTWTWNFSKVRFEWQNSGLVLWYDLKKKNYYTGGEVQGQGQGWWHGLGECPELRKSKCLGNDFCFVLFVCSFNAKFKRQQEDTCASEVWV